MRAAAALALVLVGIPPTPSPRNSLSVLAVAFSPDGRTLATSGLCRPIQLWDAGTGKELRRLAPSAGVGVAAFTPDGRFLASADRTEEAVDTAVRLFPVTGEGAARTIGRSPDRQWVTGISLAADGKTLALVAGRGPIVLSEVASGKEIRQLACEGFRSSVALSADGALVASASQDERIVRRWEVATGKELPPLDHEAVCVAFSPDGKRLAAGFDGGRAAVWDLASGAEAFSLTLPPNER